MIGAAAFVAFIMANPWIIARCFNGYWGVRFGDDN